MTDYRKGPLFEITSREGERVTACECGIQPGETCDVCGAYRGDAKDAEIERLETELDHFYGLCVDDPGKNPPLFWKDVAAEQKALIRELVAALEHARLFLEYGGFDLAPMLAALAKAKAAGYVA